VVSGNQIKIDQAKFMAKTGYQDTNDDETEGHSNSVNIIQKRMGMAAVGQLGQLGKSVMPTLPTQQTHNNTLTNNSLAHNQKNQINKTNFNMNEAPISTYDDSTDTSFSLAVDMPQILRLDQVNAAVTGHGSNSRGINANGRNLHGPGSVSSVVGPGSAKKGPVNKLTKNLVNQNSTMDSETGTEAEEVRAAFEAMQRLKGQL